MSKYFPHQSFTCPPPPDLHLHRHNRLHNAHPVLALAWAAAATVSTDPVSPPAAPKDAAHDCDTREVWTVQKSAWCCEYKKIGVHRVRGPAEEKDEKKPVTLPVEEKKPVETKPVDEKKAAVKPI